MAAVLAGAVAWTVAAQAEAPHATHQQVRTAVSRPVALPPAPATSFAAAAAVEHHLSAPSTRTDARPAARRRPVHVVPSLQYRPDRDSVQAAIDRCRGPAAWDGSPYGAPWMVIEHDFCGGAWVLRAKRGQLLRIANGPLAGTWAANGRVLLLPDTAAVTRVHGVGPLAVETCVAGTRKVAFVGFTRVG